MCSGDVKMKSVLTSIQPKWCELIVSGRKTIEVRETRAKIETLTAKSLANFCVMNVVRNLQ